MRDTNELCASGTHAPGRRIKVAGYGDLPLCRCARCGHPLVKSSFTRRWRMTGTMG